MPYHSAYNKVRTAIRRGDLVVPDACQRCGSSSRNRRLSAHHEDLGKPLEVEFLCDGCHNREHPKNVPVGEDCSWSKLSNDSVEHIRMLWPRRRDLDLTAREVASIFGISVRYLYKVVNFEQRALG